MEFYRIDKKKGGTFGVIGLTYIPFISTLVVEGMIITVLLGVAMKSETVELPPRHQGIRTAWLIRHLPGGVKS